MAKQLIESMIQEWKPDAYADKFTHAIHALVTKRVNAGASEEVVPMEEATSESSNVVDLTALLKQSLGKRGSSVAPTKAIGRRPAAKKKPADKHAARKHA